MNFFDVINTRSSVRGYKPDAVEQEKLSAVLEAGRLAPTAVNFQGFKILVIPTRGREEELKRIYRKEWFVEAPIILGVCSIPEQCWVRKWDGKPFADIDAAIVMEHMILAATAVGLGSCWVGAFDAQAAREVLALDAAWEPIAFTPLGYAKQPVAPRKKKAMEEIVVYK